MSGEKPTIRGHYSERYDVRWWTVEWEGGYWTATTFENARDIAWELTSR